MKLNWQAIHETYLSGHTATKENRKAEVVRCYRHEFAVFYYIDGKQLVLGFNPPNTDFGTAKSYACLFLNTGKIRLFNR